MSNCRHCQQPLIHDFVDLGFSPPSNAYVSKDELTAPELYFPLNIKVCHHCWLVQTLDYAAADQLFDKDYAYFSSTSSGWLAHAKQYAEKMTDELALNESSYVIEVAANDGYLLKNFVAANIPCLGIEPTASTASAARELGIDIVEDFFGQQLAESLAEQGKQADLIAGNNVYAHVPDINDFTQGLKTALKANGTITLEFPHLLQLIENNQFDTIYHEHFSYLSVFTVSHIFKRAGLRIFDVEELGTHGGSVRIYGCHQDDPRASTPRVEAIVAQEAQQGLQSLSTYQAFQVKANTVKNALLSFLLEQQRLGKKVAAYGAAAKGNTLLNYAGVKPDLLPLVVDAAAAKQYKFMPGSHIPILPPTELRAFQPDYVLILPWNIAGEVQGQLQDLGCEFVVAVPELRVL